jgi:hypothetical protein
MTSYDVASTIHESLPEGRNGALPNQDIINLPMALGNRLERLHASLEPTPPRKNVPLEGAAGGCREQAIDRL